MKVILLLSLLLIGCGKKRVIVGIEGKQGASGQQGESCKVENKPLGALITCDNTSAFVNHGKDGKSESCSTEQINGGVLLSCENGASEVIINDGINGQNGNNGQNGVDGQDGNNSGIKDIVNLCGNGKELLFEMYSGVFVAYYSSKGGYLTSLNENTNYQTTDGKKCKFSIVNGEVIYV